MDVAEWIIVAILSGTLFIFLILGIFLIIKLLKLSENAKIILETGQDIADKTENVVDNVKDFTSVGPIAKDTAISAVKKLVEKGIAKVEVVEKYEKNSTKPSKSDHTKHKK